MYSLGSAEGSSSSSGGAKCICCNSDVNITNVLDIAKVWPGHRLLPTENGMNLERKKIEMYVCLFVRVVTLRQSQHFPSHVRVFPGLDQY